jgi:hypothetical protein
MSDAVIETPLGLADTVGGSPVAVGMDGGIVVPEPPAAVELAPAPFSCGLAVADGAAAFVPGDGEGIGVDLVSPEFGEVLTEALLKPVLDAVAADKVLVAPDGNPPLP